MNRTFAQLTTMRVGGPIDDFRVAATTLEVIDIVRTADAAARPLLVMGGGSNLVAGDVGWDGIVLKIASDQIQIEDNRVTAAAGTDWDRLVRVTLDAGLTGLEALSGVPGSVGGTPVQNVGAFGTLISDLLQSVTVYDRTTKQVEIWGADRCGFGSHRQSVFKHSRRWIVLDVTFALDDEGGLSRPVKYLEVAKEVGVKGDARVPATAIRAAVLALRRRKHMLLDPDDHDTWSVGSFFINPVLSRVPRKAEACPQYDDIRGIKLSAGWLIDHAGFPPGYGRDWGNGTVGLSTRHALAVTNLGGATTSDVMKFAAHIREGVESAFDIHLGPECDLVNCSF